MLGIELTATPKTIGTKFVDFSNTIYIYSVAKAMKNSYIKDPAITTQKDFKPKNYTYEQLVSVLN